MILQNPIGWCDDTGNMVIGCDKVSPGCKNCYAATDTPARVLRSRGIETWGPKGTRAPVAALATKARRLNQLCLCDTCHQTHPFATSIAPASSPGGEDTGEGGPLTDRALCPCGGPLRRIRLFANSNSDWLDERWPAETLAALLRLIHDCPNVDFLLLTKRPEHFKERVDAAYEHSHGEEWESLWTQGEAPANAWLGVSVESEDYVHRITQLFDIPSVVRFASLEPLLGPVNIAPFLLSDYAKRCFDTQLIVSLDTRRDNKLDWLIVGGESGKGARVCNTDWIQDIAEDAHYYGCPLYVKQLGARPEINTTPERPFGRGLVELSRIKHKSGADWSEWPEALRIREFPTMGQD